jgi:hypothetical protein
MLPELHGAVEYGQKNRQTAPSRSFSCVKILVSYRKLRTLFCRLQSLDCTGWSGGMTPVSGDAKTYYTAVKQAYNSRSQAPGAPQYEACYD